MKFSRILRYIILLTVVLIVLAVIGKKSGWFGDNITYKVATEKPEKRTIVETITANGKIQPETEVKITPDVSGEIVELYVKEGDQVEQDQLLLKIKPDTYISIRDRAIASLNSSGARLAQVEARFIQSELSFKRNKKLWEERAISEAEYENAQASYKMDRADLDAARYSVKSAEATLKEAEENLIKTSIYAPMEGTVSMLEVEKGERVVGTELMSGTEIMRIADLSRMEVKVEVNENDIVRVCHMDTAIIEVDAYLGDKFRGVVTEIANSANTTGLATDQVTNFDVKIFLLPSSYAHLTDQGKVNPFLPGMSSTADIQTETRRQVLSLPIQAVTTRADSVLSKEDSARVEITGSGTADQFKEIVFVVDDNIANIREVKTGIQDNTYIEIMDGLTGDEAVVIAPYNAIAKRLKDKAKVEVVDREDLFKKD